MIKLIATAAFGLEAVVKREVIALGVSDISVLDGRVDFSGELSDIAKANIWLRSADRVLLNMGEFNANTFDELFEGTKALPWEEWIPENGKFTVTGKSVRSRLFSVPDCQAIVKKAVVERLKTRYKTEWFKEDGPEYKIQIGLLKDRATLTIDTSGPGLHKRGYRPIASPAPLKETLASALISLTYWRGDRVLLDPVCGSGTIPIECALMAKNIAPGLNRAFVSETWPCMPGRLWKDARAEAKAVEIADIQPQIFGSDIDPKAVELAKRNTIKAGVGDFIRFETKALKDITLPGRYGITVCNPPYAERLGSAAEVGRLYKDMRSVFAPDATWSLNVITPDEFFEKTYGKKADAKRKLFNGRIKTDYYQYAGEKPGRNR
ncbi:MAG: class I SAM-dependent RNA methyltransferase [Clostridiales bacterium]|jgi:putative N6-adenine-specific DNA methylase|nr:class I SAM-dependent RNA methyltransferase [Clostridiales bacterium]